MKGAILGSARRKPGRATIPYEPFFYPLDAIANWNRMYGKRGFYQYQSVVPAATARDATRAMLAVIAASGEGSFLAVLKTFGDIPSPGMLSFPRPGVTLALDFARAAAIRRVPDLSDKAATIAWFASPPRKATVARALWSSSRKPSSSWEGR